LWQQGKKEEEEFSTGPLSVLMLSVKNNTQVGGPLTLY
jgi:small nuclear ribonucleoprotein D2